MEPSELLLRISRQLEALELPYFVTGSMGTITFGEARFTNDIDLEIKLPSSQIDDFCAIFPAEEFYYSKDAIRTAIERNFQFNIIHPSSGLKFDIMLPAENAFNRSRFERKCLIELELNQPVWFASPEDMIIKKMEYSQEGGSEKHIRDILGVIKIQKVKLDSTYIVEWSRTLGLEDTWKLILSKSEEEG